MIQIIKIKDDKIKQQITEDVLRSLPHWFGIESSIKEYIDDVKKLDYFAAKDKGDYIGFVAVKFLFQSTANLHVLGIKEKYHNKGIGKRLLTEAENFIISKRCRYISVYTLSPRANNESYLKTYNFYQRFGFSPIYENNKIWDRHNPFLLMVKCIEY